MRGALACLVALACVLCAASQAPAAWKVAGVNEPSRGDPRIFALMARQGFESDALERGSTLAKICTIHDPAGRPAYDVYWFYHLAQAAQEGHGRSELVLISAAGNVLGAYDYEGLHRPRCADLLAAPEEGFPHPTLAPGQIPGSLGGDVGAFTPAPRYEHAVRVDGIWLPAAGALEFAIEAPAGPRRLPAGYRWGRCLLEVDGKTLISGRCAYSLEKGGGFWIAGPRQVYRGLDYPVPELMAGEVSRDYWAYVYKDEHGWTGYGNNDVRSVHGDRPYDVLQRKGACFADAHVRVCLWRK
jgi:hypothetical protein